MEFKIIERPGYFGDKRDEIFAGYDSKYGPKNWRIMWKWDEKTIPFFEVCKIYQDAYLFDSYVRPEPWQELKAKAKEVYDIEETDVLSGLDYLVQQGKATHIQDIAVRNVFKIRKWEFEGKELIQVRKHSTYWGALFSPGRIDFHYPEKIVVPTIQGWWDKYSVEDFYQSNKVLEARIRNETK